MPQANKSKTNIYPAKHYQSDVKQLDTYYRIIEDNPLATLIFTENNNIEISHIPCHFANEILERKRKTSANGVKNNTTKTKLMAHVSNHHPLAKKLQQSTGVSISLVFHGDDAYVSPNDVSEQNRQAQMVPTWNYAKVHIGATAIEITDNNEKHMHMAQTSDYFEYKKCRHIEDQESNKYWALSDAPNTAVKHMLDAITVFIVQVNNIEGILKLSQNKSIQVKEEIAKKLTMRGTAALGQLMLEL
jgi:transcriptional regulator